MSKVRSRTNSKRKDISLMTLLANEATGESRKILKKYGEPDATDHEDLEVKLANLYFKTDDKRKLEKELSDIHPHKNWILKYSEPKIEIKKEEVKVEVKPEEKTEQKSNANGICSGNYCCKECERMNGFNGTMYSSMNGTQTEQGKMAYIVMFGMVAVLGITMYAISKK